jgi:superfamily I DNA/RNA helicase
MKGHGVTFVVADNATTYRYWDDAYTACGSSDLPLGFYKDEWKHVVQAQGITTVEAYLQAPRTGRGTSLVRKQRIAVWKVFQEYRSLLEAAGKVEFSDIIRETRLYLEKNPASLPYKAVLADEVQDFSLAELRLLRTLVGPSRNDLFLVGDAHQRIYGHRSSLGKAGIEVRGRSKRLYVNYRTTEKIRNWAVARLSGIDIDDLNDGHDHLSGYRSLRTGVEPQVQTFPTQLEERLYITSCLREWLHHVAPEQICICARTADLLQERFRPAVQDAGLPMVTVDSESDEASLGPGIRLATLHRIKGLEFPRVIIAGLDRDILPYPLTADQLGDAASRQDHDIDDKCLLYVAATRARDELVVTATRPASIWIEPGGG